MDTWLRDRLVCPRDNQQLETRDSKLVCPDGHVYPVVSDIPIMLVDDCESTHGYIDRTLEKVAAIQSSGEAIREVENGANTDGAVDKYVQSEVPYTSGNLYIPIQNKLSRYPIPTTRLRMGNGEHLLDIGCNWGRWSIAAARKNYKTIGLDPSLDAVLAARRVSRQLGVECDFVVGDARFLPFADSSFDVVFSFGVFQHFSKENARISISDLSRVLKEDGESLIQMANKYGIRQYQQHRRRGFTEGVGVEVRYWRPAELLETFIEIIGPTTMTVDCFFGLGIQKADVDLLPVKYQAVVYSSEILRKLSTVIKPLIKVADSLYLESVNKKDVRSS